MGVSSLASVRAIAAGKALGCALTTAGGVKCWGYNRYGQLGDGTTTDHHAPVDVSGLRERRDRDRASATSTPAPSRAAGRVKCWGYNRYGQLGDGTTIDRRMPVDVSGLAAGVTAITAGGGHTCALTSSRRGQVLGQQLPRPARGRDDNPPADPVAVSGLASGVAAIAAGGEAHACALTTAGGVKCWGYNGYGQLGDGTTADRRSPVDVSGLEGGVEAIAAGGYGHTCALTTAGEVKCWGRNSSGQLGDGTSTERRTPVAVTLAGLQADDWSDAVERGLSSLPGSE